MERSPSFRRKAVPDDISIEMKCKLLKTCYQQEALKKLKEKETDLLKALENEKNEVLDMTKSVTQLADLRRRYEIEKEIEKILDGKICENVLKTVQNLISSTKQERNKMDIENCVFESESQIRQYMGETLAQLKTFEKREKNTLNDIIELNKNLTKLEECLNKYYDDQIKCPELLRLIQRLALHLDTLKTIKYVQFAD